MHGISVAETVLSPTDAKSLIDWLIAHGARRTVEGRALIVKLARIEEQDYEQGT